MLTGRPALATVLLCLVCLLALKPQPAAAAAAAIRCTRDIIKWVGELIKKTSDLWLDCRLYTPTIQDYQQNCPSSTLKCFADEVKVLVKEWETVGVVGFRNLKLNIKLEILASRFNQTESECRQCELLKVQNATVFLEDLRSTLQIINTDFCR
ncbi:interleukin 15, like isoform X3 [Lates calcarifer]|uniref:Interleukin n=1 Tax=Lates calcarifer TaxID=8187 RepID=A0AAJ8AVP2_LATCA|nr:interleukin 15, like isoform X3 [Lates calcarifer]